VVMPYIDRKMRDRVRVHVEYGLPEDATVGALTYVLTRVACDFIRRRGKSFQSLAEVVAALEQTKDEFQRRVIHPYEDEKMEANGDVYPPGLLPVVDGSRDPTDEMEPCVHGKRLCGCRNLPSEARS